MEMNRFVKDTLDLYAMAEEIADALSRLDGDASRQAETALRTSMAAARFAWELFVSVRNAARSSEEACRLVREAERRCERAIGQLSSRLGQSMRLLSSSMRRDGVFELLDGVAILQ